MNATKSKEFRRWYAEHAGEYGSRGKAKKAFSAQPATPSRQKPGGFLARKTRRSNYIRAKEALHTSGVPHEPRERTHVHVFRGGHPIATRLVHKREGKTVKNPKPRSGKRSTYQEPYMFEGRHCVKCGFVNKDADQPQVVIDHATA